MTVGVVFQTFAAGIKCEQDCKLAGWVEIFSTRKLLKLLYLISLRSSKPLHRRHSDENLKMP